MNVATVNRKAKQPLIQSLEPRRLMSLTGAPDYAPVHEAPTQLTHSFGFENQLPPSAGFGNAPFHFGDNSANFGGSSDGSDFENQLARAIAQGTPITMSITTGSAAATITDNTAVSTPAPVTGTTLSSMYATLNNSTITSIDNADTTDAEKSFTATIAGTSDVPQSPALSVGDAQSQILIIGKTGVENAAAADPTNAVSTAIALPSTISIPGNPTLASMAQSTVPQFELAAAVEAELQNVSTLAREMVQQMGRDLAIEAAHLESTAASLAEPLISGITGWRSAAALTVAIAAVAAVQGQTNREKTAKSTSLFSSQLIETVQ